MPPHCDTLDGPVVTAAKAALKAGNVNLILPWAPKKAEGKIKRAFEKTLRVRKLSKAAADLADYWFFETVVRLHREGEGASYMGLKPAGLDWGPVVKKAEKTLKNGNPKEVIAFLQRTVDEELQKRFKHAMEKRILTRTTLQPQESTCRRHWASFCIHTACTSMRRAEERTAKKERTDTHTSSA